MPDTTDLTQEEMQKIIDACKKDMLSAAVPEVIAIGRTEVFVADATMALTMYADAPKEAQDQMLRICKALMVHHSIDAGELDALDDEEKAQWHQTRVKLSKQFLKLCKPFMLKTAGDLGFDLSKIGAKIQ